MAKNKRKKNKPHQSQPAANPEAIAAELREQLQVIRDSGDNVPGAIWGRVQQLLLKSPIENAKVGKVIMGRSIEMLEHMITSIETSTPLEDLTTQPPVDDEKLAAVSAEEKKRAMHAFRKRLKLTKLDHESKLGVGPMSGGRKADIDAILPPREFDQVVWDALIADGKLRKTGGGFLALGDC